MMPVKLMTNENSLNPEKNKDFWGYSNTYWNICITRALFHNEKKYTRVHYMRCNLSCD